MEVLSFSGLDPGLRRGDVGRSTSGDVGRSTSATGHPAQKLNSLVQPVAFREYPRHGCRGTAHKDVLVAVPEGDWLHQAPRYT